MQNGRGIHRLVAICGSVQDLVDEDTRRLFAAEGIEEEEEEEEGEVGERPPEYAQDLAQRWGLPCR